MDWTRTIDIYCERVGPAFWAEPVNALTNAAFFFVGCWLWSDARGIERGLVALMLMIGLGSFLFHTVATAWAGLADMAPIALFALLYVYAAHRRYLGWGRMGAGAAAAAFAPAAVFAGLAAARVPWLQISASYWPIALAILGYGAALARRMPPVGRGLLAAGGLLTLSLVARSLDQAVCPAMPLGTHFAWHLLNAVVLGVLVSVLKWHRLEPCAPRR